MADLKLSLSDKAIAKLPFADVSQYKVRDTELAGFLVLVGRRTKTFMAQGEFWSRGKRQFSSRVKIAEVGELTTQKARGAAKQVLGSISKGERPGQAQVQMAGAVTLRIAWVKYRDGHMARKGRSERTIASYRDHVERVMVEWLDTPLAELGEEPGLVAAKHDEITKRHGPYIANGTMRTLRAVYNHARKTDRKLPDNPVAAIDWNGESRRDTALGLADLPVWFDKVAALDNPIRREFHLFTLLSGCRPTALKEARPEHIRRIERALHIPSPKGGAKKAFDIPLSREMICCLARARRLGSRMYPEQASRWIFPAESASGHLVEQKEDRSVLSKWGNDLRQSFRTLAQAAGVSEFDARLLMNHALPGVNAGYITRHKLLHDHLRAQQNAISRTIMRAARAAADKPGPVRDWLTSNTAR